MCIMNSKVDIIDYEIDSMVRAAEPMFKNSVKHRDEQSGPAGTGNKICFLKRNVVGQAVSQKKMTQTTHLLLSG